MRVQRLRIYSYHSLVKAPCPAPAIYNHTPLPPDQSSFQVPYTPTAGINYAASGKRTPYHLKGVGVLSRAVEPTHRLSFGYSSRPPVLPGQEEAASVQ